MTLKELQSLNPVELELISTQIYKLIKDKVTNQTANCDNFKNRINRCPHCGSIHFIKYGFNKKHRQKFYCKNCKTLFSHTTKTIYSHSISNYNLWKSFIACEINGLTLEQEKIQIGKSKTTCYNMRHKLYSAISNLHKNEQLTGVTEIDATYTKINLKGTKPKNMPRISKKRGNTSAFRGLSHHKLCLITAIDENDSMIFKIAGLGPEDLNKYLSLKEFFSNNVSFVSDSKPCIKSFAEKMKFKIEQIPVIANIKRYATDSGKTISSVNQLHQELSILISKKHGVSTRHLQGYLDWLVFCKQLKYHIKAETRFSYTYMDVMRTSNIVKTKEICKRPMPIDLASAYEEYHYGIFA